MITQLLFRIATIALLAVVAISANSQTVSHRDTTITFLKLVKRFDPEDKLTYDRMSIDTDYCKIISDPEKAAIAYTAFGIGSECWWDGEANDNRSNLKCLIPSALGLGYQCSDTQLHFLRKWFRNDSAAMKSLEGCPTEPWTSTIQNAFDKIVFSTKGDVITVHYKVSGFNMRENESWDWTETVTFKVSNDAIAIIKDKRGKLHSQRAHD